MFVGITLHMGYGIRRYLFDVEFDTIAGILYIFFSLFSLPFLLNNPIFFGLFSLLLFSLT